MVANCVLLVEDDVATCEITAIVLGDAGYDVVSAHDLASGIAMSRQRTDIGVFMTDMNLGRGQQATALIRQIRNQDARAPVVLTSADDAAAVTADELNVVFLAKPYDRLALLTAIACARACNI